MTSGGPAGRAGRQERRQRAVGSPGPVRTALFAAALALFAVAAPGASGAGWLPPANVSPAVPSSYQYDVLSLQDVAVDGQGNAIATWIQADIEEPEVVRAATRAPGGAWSGAVTIAADAEGKVDLKVAANAAGDAAIAWNGYRSGKEVVKVALRPAGGAWGAPLTLTDPDGVAREPDVVVDEAGNVTVAWAQRDGSTWSIRAATKPAGGDWGEPDVLSDSETTADSPQLAVDPQGGLTAVWLLQTGKGGEGVVQSTSRPPGGAWHAEPVDLSGPEPLATVPRVAVDDDQIRELPRLDRTAGGCVAGGGRCPDCRRRSPRRGAAGRRRAGGRRRGPRRGCSRGRTCRPASDSRRRKSRRAAAARAPPAARSARDASPGCGPPRSARSRARRPR